MTSTEMEIITLTGSLRGCVSVLAAIRRSDHWPDLPGEIKDDLEMALTESREALGEEPACQDGTCRWR